MGDYGAEVIKIEPPGEGDPQRKLGQAHSVPQHPVNFCWHMANPQQEGGGARPQAPGRPPRCSTGCWRRPT